MKHYSIISKKFKSISIILLIVSLVLTAGCNSHEEDLLGTIKDKTYHNNYFGFDIKIPKLWFVFSDAQKAEAMKSIQKLNVDGQTGDDISLKTSIDLLGAYQLPYGNVMNCGILCYVEQLPGDISKSSDYLEKIKKMILEKNQKIKLEKDIYSEEIGGKNFSAFELSTRNLAIVTGRKYYATIIKDYMFCIVSTYNIEGMAYPQEKTITDFLKTAKFK